MDKLIDGAKVVEVVSRKKQKNGIENIKTRLVCDTEKITNEKLRKYSVNRLEGDLQLDGYILLGWFLGHSKNGGCHTNWNKSEKYGYISEPGMAAYYPVTGARWVYIWETHARYAPHPDPIWQNERWTHFVEIDDKPQRLSIKNMLSLLSAPKAPYEGSLTQKYEWMPSVPLWLLDNKKDMRPLYLNGANL